MIVQTLGGMIMENTQIIANRIKTQAKQKNISVKDILSFYAIDKNLLNKLSKGKDTSTQNIYKIADYLHVSVDYLLGRTDIPTSTYSINNKNTTINGTQANVINNTVASDNITEEFFRLFEKLSFEEKLKVMQYVSEKKYSSDSDEK